MSLFSSSAAPLIIVLLLLVGSVVARGRHIITVRAVGLRPGSLAWDPIAQHFLVGSRHRPAVSSVSDAGVVESLVSDSILPPDSYISGIAVDHSRRRLLVALARPAALAAYDLRSPRPHSRIFAAPLPDPAAVPGGVAVDPATGDAFVTTRGGQIWRVDLEGRASVLSEASIFAGGLGGVARMRGFLLTVQSETGKVFKVDAEDGAAREVLAAGRGRGRGRALAPGAETVAVASDGSAVVAGGSTARMLKSEDAWGEAGVYDEIDLDEGWLARGVAIREGRRAYVLVVPPVEEGEERDDDDEGNTKRKKTKSSGRIEEVEWGRDKDGDVVWGMVLLGLGLAYFLYWRFQMGQLVGAINKKRA